MGTPNWGKLKAQGRVKDVGLPWSAEEAKALAAGVPADYVRRGALTVEDYETLVAEDAKAEEKTGVKPVAAMNTAELRARCEKLGITGFTADAPDEVLRNLISEAENTDTVAEEKTGAAKKTAKKTTKKTANK